MEGNGARSRFDDILSAGKKPIGTLIGSLDPAITEMAGSAGYDFVILDAEHSPQGPVEMLNHIRAAESVGAVPLVRVWENSRPLIQKFLDIGAEGLIIPHVDTAADARAAVAAVRFPPSGERSMCPVVHASRYSLDRWPRYVAHTAANVLVIPIIESPLAVANLDDILTVDGVDLVFFGPGDYSASIGTPMDSPEVEEAWHRVKSLAKDHGKPVMAPSNVPGLTAEDDLAIVHSMDLMLINDMLSRELQCIRDRFGS